MMIKDPSKRATLD
jgi:hypothetical protein